MLPPLRSRPQDIPELARHFARNAGKRLGLSTTELKITSDELAPLLRYEWPGNVRELAAVIERAAILGRGKRLDIQAALGATVSPRTSTPGSERPKSASVSGEPETFRTLDAAMGLHIEQALVLARGQIEGKGGAAELLDINPHTLRARMKKLGIDWNRYRALADVRRVQRA
jgi:DNA-binding NtrC family response regulator